MISSLIHQCAFSTSNRRSIDPPEGKIAIIVLPLLICLVSFGMSPAAAINGALEPDPDVISLPGPFSGQTGIISELQILSSSEVLAEAHREFAGWSLDWDDEGGGILTGSGPLARVTAPASFAAEFVSRHGALLGMTSEDLEIRSNQRAGHLNHYFYRQQHEDLPIIGSRLAFTFGATGRPLYFTAKTAPVIDVSTDPVYQLEDAQRIALADLPAYTEVKWTSEELGILPRLYSGLDSDRLVWRLTCSANEPNAAWRMTVDSRSGELLERKSLLYAADASAANSGATAPAQTEMAVNGSITGTHMFPSPFGDELATGFPHQTVYAIESGVDPIYTLTDEAGLFDFGTMEIEDPESFMLQSLLAGPYTVVYNYSRNEMPPSMLVPNPASPIDLIWDDSNSNMAARTVYQAMNTAHDRLKQIDPDATFLDIPVGVVALDRSGACNAGAYINPYDPWIHFYAASGPCPDIAQIPDVAFHEYGHLVTMFTYFPEDAPDHFHEGFSDYFAATITNSSNIGNGFYGPDSHLRELSNDHTPTTIYSDPNCGNDSHCVGLLIGGALWDLRTALVEELGASDGITLADSLFHFMRYGHPMTYRDALIHLLLQDDDDDDRSNGTPHFDAIAGSFARHEIGDFSVEMTHQPLLDTEETATERQAEITLNSIYPLNRESVKIHYAIDRGEWFTETMDGTGWEFSGSIPAASDGSVVHYYFTASDSDGNEVSLPAGAPNDLYSYWVITDVIPPAIEHQSPLSPTAQQDILWVQGDVTDNTGLFAGVTAYVQFTAPEKTLPTTDTFALYPKPDALHPHRWEGAIDLSNQPAGTVVEYYLLAEDAAAETNSARYPESGTIDLVVHRGETRDFETGTEDLILTGDWVHTLEPNEIGPDALSGVGLVQTGLSITADNTKSELIFPAIDLTDWSAAKLVFDHWFETEADWDGGQIYFSVDEGESWRLLTPAGGYPLSIQGNIYRDGVLDETYGPMPAFSGSSNGWQEVTIPLDFGLGESIQYKLMFWTDEATFDTGWYVDNVKIVEEQALVPPWSLAATSGDNEQVALNWAAPVGIDTEADNFLGYQVYRAEEPNYDTYTLLNSTPIFDLTYTDHSVTNGTHYQYQMTTAYSSGESARTPAVMGYPYRVEMAMTAAEWSISGSPTESDSLVISNEGTGDLLVDFYLANHEDDFNQILPTYTLDGIPDPMATIVIQDSEDAGAPDLKYLSAQEVPGLLILTYPLFGPTPNPETDFTMQIGFDTDLSRATGIPTGNAGAEMTVFMGRWVFEMAGMPAVIISGQGEFLGVPPMIRMTEGADSLQVAIPAYFLPSNSPIGIISQVHYGPMMGPPMALAQGTTPAKTGLLDPQIWRSLCSAGALNASLTDNLPDQLPDVVDLEWCTMLATSAVVAPNEPFSLPFEIDLTGEVEGDFNAKIFIRSNDEDYEQIEIPLVVHLRDVVGEQMTLWSTSFLSDGIHFEWAPAEPDSFPGGFELSRWSGRLEDEESSAVVLTGAPLSAPDDSLYTYTDRTVQSGDNYFYRITGIKADGTEVKIEPPAHPLYNPGAPTQLAFTSIFPNPMRIGTSMRLHSPGKAEWDLKIFDVTGRQVRQLTAKGDLGAGIHVISWDGRSNDGNLVHQGLYFAVMREGTRQVTRPIVVVR